MLSGLSVLVTSVPSTCMHVFELLYLLYLPIPLVFVLIAVHIELLIDQFVLIC